MSSFVANMALRRNALDHQEDHQEAANAVLEALYVDDSLVGADNVDGAVKLREELQWLLSLGGFEFIMKCKVSYTIVEQSIPQHLLDQQSSFLITYSQEFVKVLGVE